MRTRRAENVLEGVGHEGRLLSRAWFREPFGGGIVDGMSPRAVSFRKRGPSPASGHPLPRGAGDPEIRRPRMSSSDPIAPDDAWAADEIHEDARDRQRLRLCRASSTSRPRRTRRRWRSRSATGISAIGSDGLILIGPSERADARMRMFNADGSEAEMCGNGVRCVAKYVYDHGLAAQGPGDGRDGPGRPDARPGGRGGQGPARPRRHGRADPAGRRHPDHPAGRPAGRRPAARSTGASSA